MIIKGEKPVCKKNQKINNFEKNLRDYLTKNFKHAFSPIFKSFLAVMETSEEDFYTDLCLNSGSVAEKDFYADFSFCVYSNDDHDGGEDYRTISLKQFIRITGKVSSDGKISKANFTLLRDDYTDVPDKYEGEDFFLDLTDISDFELI